MPRYRFHWKHPPQPLLRALCSHLSLSIRDGRYADALQTTVCEMAPCPWLVEPRENLRTVPDLSELELMRHEVHRLHQLPACVGVDPLAGPKIQLQVAKVAHHPPPIRRIEGRDWLSSTGDWSRARRVGSSAAETDPSADQRTPCCRPRRAPQHAVHVRIPQGADRPA